MVLGDRNSKMGFQGNTFLACLYHRGLHPDESNDSCDWLCLLHQGSQGNKKLLPLVIRVVTMATRPGEQEVSFLQVHWSS